MRVQVDRDRCAGAGLCALALPAVFDQADEDGKVLLLDLAPPDELRDQLGGVVARCPAGAITAGEDQRSNREEKEGNDESGFAR